jgi:hypothetical protein
VRAAAAYALGYLGDGRAVRPLIDALERSFTARSAWRQRVLGTAMRPWSESLSALPELALVLILGFVPVGLMHRLASDSSDILVSATSGLAVFGVLAAASCAFASHLSARRKVGRASLPYVRALLRIARRQPLPEVQRVVAELGIAATDEVQHDAYTRRTYRKALRRLKAVASAHAAYPLPGLTPEPRALELPIPSKPAHHEASGASLSD